MASPLVRQIHFRETNLSQASNQSRVLADKQAHFHWLFHDNHHHAGHDSDQCSYRFSDHGMAAHHSDHRNSTSSFRFRRWHTLASLRKRITRSPALQTLFATGSVQRHLLFAIRHRQHSGRQRRFQGIRSSKRHGTSDRQSPGRGPHMESKTRQRRTANL